MGSSDDIRQFTDKQMNDMKQACAAFKASKRSNHTTTRTIQQLTSEMNSVVGSLRQIAAANVPTSVQINDADSTIDNGSARPSIMGGRNSQVKRK